MEWKKNYGESEQCFALKPDEAKRIAEILKTKLSVLQSRYQRRLDKRDSGEATEHDLDMLMDAEADFQIVKWFIEECK